MKALIPGSFDPPTFGHLDLITRSAKLFDILYVGIGENREKKCLLTLQEREQLLKQLCLNISNVKIITFHHLTIDAVKAYQIDVLIKGVRNVTDLDHEMLQAAMNNKMAQIETLFLPAHLQISATFVREIAAAGQSLSNFVSPEIEQFLMQKRSNS